MSKKVKKEKIKKDRDIEISKQLVKSASAVVCAAALCISMTTAAEQLSNAKVKVAEVTPVQSASASNTSTASNEVAIDTGVDTSANDYDVVTADDSTATEAASEGTTEAAQASTDTASKAKTSNGVPSTTAEIVEYCNKALNAAKAAKVGYTKTFVRQGGDNLPSLVSNVIATNKTTTAAKGDANIVDDFPAAGYEWSSKLRASDVKSADLKQNGQYYEITLKLGTEKNPGKGEASSYGRVMSVIDENDAKELLSAVKSINMTYHDGYVYAKIDSKTGKLVKAEFSASADISATLSVIGDLTANNIKSTETFTDIKW